MSRRLLLAALLLAALSRDATAQAISDTATLRVAALEAARMADSIRAVIALKERTDSVAALEPMDTVSESGISFTVVSGRGAFARQMVRSLLENTRPVIRDTVYALLSGARMAFQRTSVRLSLPNGRGGRATFSAPARVIERTETVANDVRQLLVNSLVMGLDDTAKVWLDGGIGTGRQDVEFYESQFRDLATGSSIPRRGCYSGNLDACLTALLLRDPGRDTIAAWFTGGDLQSIVRRMENVDGRAREIPEVYQCIEAGLESRCRQALRKLRLATLPLPIAQVSMQGLLETATDMGGKESLGRFARAAAVPLARRIELAAGAPLHVVVRRWRERVMAARPRPPSIQVATVVTYVLTASVLVLTATTLRGRWT